MTGLYAPPGRHRRHVRGPRSRTQTGRSVSRKPAAYQGYLNRNCVTIAEVLKSAGYHTYMAGKWHLGMHGQEKWPLQRGFDRFYGILAGASNICGPTAAAGSRSTTPNCRLRRRRIIRRMLSPTMPSSSSTATRATASPISSTWPITLPTGRSMPNRRTSTSFSASTTRVGRRSVRLVSAVRPNWASWTIRGSSPRGSRAAGRI